MGKNVYFDICGFVLLLVLLGTTILRRMYKGRANRGMLYLQVVALLGCVADIFSVLMDNAVEPNLTVRYLANTLYLFFHLMICFLYYIYLVSLTDTWHKVRKNKIGFAFISFPYVMVVVLLIINLFKPGVLFEIDAGLLYERGKYFFLLYLVSAFYYAVCAIHLLRYRTLFRKGQIWSLCMIYPLTIGAVLYQMYVPAMILENFAIAITLLLTTMMVHRPEDRIDVETGLAKKTAFANDMRRSFINGKPQRIIIVNIGNYKSVKDMLDYDTLELFRKRIATRLEEICRSHGLHAEIYYVGNGRFRCVVDEKYFDRVDEAAYQINDLLKYNIYIGQVEISIVGCVCVVRCPEDISDLDSLMLCGRNISVDDYTGEVLAATDLFDRKYYNLMKDLDGIIEQALAEHRFEVYYQPIFSVKDSRFNSAEALLRLRDEKYGFISPEIFIRAAEQSGAIYKIGAYVLEEVCKFIGSPEFRKLNIDYIEVNLSVAQCMQANLVQEVLETLEKYHVSPDQINLEITETATSHSTTMLNQNLTELTNAGIKFSLDDFGTGYSNMKRIASLPLHIVKLDKSFVNIEESPKLRIVVENTIRMIKDMDMKIVVEGIETAELARIFSNLECEYIQGYYYSKPLPKIEFVNFIKQAG